MNPLSAFVINKYTEQKMWNPLVILITGGAGFIGVNLAHYLSKKIITDLHIIIVDNCITGSFENFKENSFKNKNLKLEFLNLDITDDNFLTIIQNKYSKIDQIYHLASLASPKYYKKYPLETLEVGYTGTKNVLELTKYYQCKFLFSSTSEVYGDPIVSPQAETYFGNVNTVGSRSCYSDDTEILTENGYKLFSELDYEDKVATLNSNNELEYNIPNEIIKEKYIGEMYEYKNWNIDLNVTPNHKMYVKKRHHNKFELLPADSKFSWDRSVLKKTCDYIGKEQEWFYFPNHLRTLRNQKTPFVEKVNMDLWLEFMGYYLSEGHTRISTQKKRNINGKIYDTGIFKVQISQSESVNPIYFEKIKNCLDKMPFHYNISRAGNSYFVISNKQLAHYLIQFGKSKDKYIPSDLLSLSKRQLTIIFNSLIIGDGSISKHNTNRISYSSSSYKLISNIQEILLKIGTFGNILVQKKRKEDIKQNKMYCVQINSRPERDYTYSNPTINNYNGYVYCVNVKNHVIFVRRNGKALFCGNCYDESKRVAETLVYEYQKIFNLDTKIARIFNTYGPYMNLNDGRIITEIIKHHKLNTTVEIYGDGSKTRSFSYITDTLDQLFNLMNTNKIHYPVNIGNDNEISINQLIDIFNTLVDKKLNIVYKPNSENDPKMRKPCLKLNNKILGKRINTNEKDGLLEMLNFYK